jgi:hypothetical protein
LRSAADILTAVFISFGASDGITGNVLVTEGMRPIEILTRDGKHFVATAAA